MHGGCCDNGFYSPVDRVGFFAYCVCLPVGRCWAPTWVVDAALLGRAQVYILDGVMLTLLGMIRSCDLSVWDCSTADSALAC